MRTILITEGAVQLRIPDPKLYPLSAKAPVFYNPAMRENRDISVLICKLLRPKSALDLLAASGARGLRLKKEAKLEDVWLNDANPKAVQLMKRNAQLNKLKVKIRHERANRLLTEGQWDYIDIDPFGPPIPFLDGSVRALKPHGLLAVTATDTAALCGTYPKACLRKYGARPLRNYLMHEIGLRILIKKVQEVAGQYEIALTPIFSHSTAHYMRAYFRADQGANRTDAILSQHGMFKGAGPLWLGQLWDVQLVNKMLELAVDDHYILRSTYDLLAVIAGEAKIPVVGFFDLHALAKAHKLPTLPKLAQVLTAIRKRAKAARTHFSKSGIRTTMSERALLALVQAFSRRV